jgi:hypothetical protein
MGLSNAKRYVAFMRHMYDKNKAFIGEGHAVFGNSFSPSASSSSIAERYREQWDLDDYGSSMPTRLVNYMSNEDTSSD